MKNKDTDVVIAPDKKALYESYYDFLDHFNLHVLRGVGRHFGVNNPAAKPKSVLMQHICLILLGEMEPVPLSNRGAPVKDSFLDPSIIEEINKIREADEKRKRVMNVDLEFYDNVISVSEVDTSFHDAPVYLGTLDIQDAEYSFIRSDLRLPLNKDGIRISQSDIEANSFRDGDYVLCYTKKDGVDQRPCFKCVISVCGVTLGKYEKRCEFDRCHAVYPTQKIEFSAENAIFNLLDVCAPIAFGQRVLVGMPRKANKYGFIRKATKILSDRYENDINIFVLSVDGKEEELYELKNKLGERAKVYYSGFGDDPKDKLRNVELVFNQVKRYAEYGENCVVFVDSFSTIAKVAILSNSENGTVVCDRLTNQASILLRNLFATSKKGSGAGTITLFGMVENDSPLGEDILSELDRYENAHWEFSLKNYEGLPVPELEKCKTEGRARFDTEENIAYAEKLSGVAMDESLLALAKNKVFSK